MAVTNDYLQYVLEQLAGIPHVTSRRMFGGIGLYSDGFFFSLIDNDTLYFKVDDSNRGDYTARGMAAFRPFPDKPDLSMSYFTVPADALEDADELAAWARKSIYRSHRHGETAQAQSEGPQGRKGQEKMSDDELMTAIDAKSLPLESFTHTEHVHLAWACLRKYPLLLAMAEFRRLLIAYATHHAKPNLYHETVTFAYLLLVFERMARSPHLTSWPGFSTEHADLLTFRNGPLFRFYPSDVLQNAEARSHFVLPDDHQT